MAKIYHSTSTKRFLLVCLGILVAGGYILATALGTMLNKSEYWSEVSKKFVTDSIQVDAKRGSILSCGGEVMVASLPEFILYMDYIVIEKDSLTRAKAQHLRDSLLDTKIDSIADGMAEIFNDYSAAWFKERILEGKKKKSHAWRIYPKHATYIQYRRCKELPLFRESIYTSGFYADCKMQRNKPYGSLATRFLGGVYADSDAAKYGLEVCYDTLLRGTTGIAHKQKVRNRKVTFIDKEPVNGRDLITTIDVTMQDIAEKAIVNKLKEVGGDKGVVILMETATGDVKAMVSMTRYFDSNGNAYYIEAQNDALTALWEPGSTFKTGSIMVALEDGLITPKTVVNCAGGIYMMHGRPMKDHNWHRGGYGDLTVTEILGQSSNIGVSRIIDDNYHDCPEKFVDGLHKMGVGISLDLPMGANPRVRRPNKDGSNWSKTALAWMSIGYETQIPPISTVTFYNAIANNGKMVRPRFVKGEMENGVMVKEYPVEVIKEKICSDHTLRDIRMILEKVVSEGLGKKAGNGGKKFKVSGKTGTAQMAKNGSYASHTYMVSFCGYFPSDDPKYSCIVCIQKDGLPASGGGQCGPVFSEISQHVMNQGVFREAEEASDSLSAYTAPIARQRTKPEAGKVPDVVGMGAHDAVFLLQQQGMKVRLRGKGVVSEQSIPAGTQNPKGRTITLNLAQNTINKKQS